jgi:hypothetical protein
MLRLVCTLTLAASLAGCVVAPPYASAPGYGYAPGYYGPSVDVGIGVDGGHGYWHR